jgi:3-phosphoshikimate 1-carboxyvinyltransferase
VITGLSSGDDVRRSRLAVEAMGAGVEVNGEKVIVEGGSLREPSAVIDVGNSGTGMRLLTGMAAGLPWLTVLSGDASLHSRPMGRVADPLRQMGARIDGADNGQRAPLVIRGGDLKAIDYTPPVASAQLKSAVLIAGLFAEGETVVHEPVLSRAHTEEMLPLFGADLQVEELSDGATNVRVRRSQLHAHDIDVPGDPSQAAFWMVAAAVVPDSDITIENVYLGPGRGGIVDVLVRMGADIDLCYRDATAADIRIRHSALHGTEIRGDEIPSLIDELPVLSIAAACAEGTTVVADAAEMRVKESDRITAVVRQIGGLGLDITEQSDGFTVNGRPGGLFAGGTVNAHLDHRIAMTGAIAALRSSAPVRIEGWDSVDSSYPTFSEDLAKLRPAG